MKERVGFCIELNNWEKINFWNKVKYLVKVDGYSKLVDKKTGETIAMIPIVSGSLASLLGKIWSKKFGLSKTIKTNIEV